MRAIAGSRWLGLLLMALGAGGVILLVNRLIGTDAALLQPLSARLPLAMVGNVVSPVLSGLLGVGAGLLGARLTPWTDRRLRSLVLAGCGACLAWMLLVGSFWFGVQAELMTLLGAGPAGRAGMSALSTLLLPSTAVVFGSAAVIAARVRLATRAAALEGHVQTAKSWGVPATAPVIRSMLRGALPIVLVVAMVEFLLLYAGSLAVQAVYTEPSLATTLPLLPAESLPVVLVAALLCICALIVTAIPLARIVAGPQPAPLRATRLAAGAHHAAGAPTRASTRFRSSDLLDIRDLTVHHGDGPASGEPLAGINLTVARGQSLAVIGGNGDGSSLLCHAIAGLLPPRSAISSGSILFDGTELVGLSERQFAKLRGHRIGFLPAPGDNRLIPDERIGRQLARLVVGGPAGNQDDVGAQTAQLLTVVGIEDAATVLAAYPHQLAGAIAQRVLLAGALAREPRLLLADHPTRNLPAGDEAGFLDLLHTLQDERGFTLIVAAAGVENVVRCDRVAVMREGTIVEYAAPHDLLSTRRLPPAPRDDAR